jgi:hypothetical protein
MEIRGLDSVESFPRTLEKAGSHPSKFKKGVNRGLPIGRLEEKSARRRPRPLPVASASILE